MEARMLSITYSLISLLLAAADVWIAKQAFKKNGKTGKYLGRACLFAAVVDLSYLVSVLSKSYFIVSLFSSIYFASIDWMLICLLGFVGYYTRTPMNRANKTIFWLLVVWLIVDTVIFAVNPFYEICIRYISQDTLIARYRYQMLMLYDCHLAYTYLMVVLVLGMLLYRTIRVPSDYRRQYIYAVAGIVAIVGVNGIFLFQQRNDIYNLLDYSICGYSVMAFWLYWSCFEYSARGMLDHFRNRIFESLEQGIILFDFEDRLVLHNERVRKIAQKIPFDEDMNMQRFMEELGIPFVKENIREAYTLQCYAGEEKREQPVRCDYRLLENRKKQIVGHLFVLSDTFLETDLLTGFQNWESFERFVKDNPAGFGYPVVVAICDINNLSTINSTLGRSNGDLAIQKLADKMRLYLPKETYFVRGQDANMIAICHQLTEKKVLRMMEQVQKEFDWSIQFAVSTMEKNSGDVLDAVNIARQGMKAKKLMNRQSGHSELLTSLVCALRECDIDTEEHVQRTQKMGAMLGKRLKLSDVEMSNLSLLCILHDIGKIGIPLEILNKPGKLTEAEWKLMKTHTEKGYEIAKSSQELSGIADLILHHHEKWDGTGYPDGLSRESIPLLSRIIAVVDAYDAMVNNRSYGRAVSEEIAQEELRRCAGKQFDPWIVSEFLCMRKEERIKEGKEKNVSVQNYSDVFEEQEVLREEGEKTGSKFIHVLQYCRYVIDEKMKIVSVDDLFEKMTGYSREDIETGEYSQLDMLFPEDRTQYLCMVNEQLSKAPQAYFEHRIRRKDGSAVFVLCYGKRYFDSAERQGRSEIIIVDSADTFAMQYIVEGERSKAQSRLKRWENMYRLDSLTGLLNHKAFKNDVEAKLLNGDVRVMFLMVDVDKFKEYNDTNGHRAGDEFLILVAQSLTVAAGADSLVCRMGGDEFAAALFYEQDQREEEMYEKAQSIFDSTNMTVVSFKGGTSLSIGVSISGKDGNTFNELYEAADKALYDSKAKGRARLPIHN